MAARFKAMVSWNNFFTIFSDAVNIAKSAVILMQMGKERIIFYGRKEGRKTEFY